VASTVPRIIFIYIRGLDIPQHFTCVLCEFTGSAPQYTTVFSDLHAAPLLLGLYSSGWGLFHPLAHTDVVLVQLYQTGLGRNLYFWHPGTLTLRATSTKHKHITSPTVWVSKGRLITSPVIHNSLLKQLRHPNNSRATGAYWRQLKTYAIHARKH